MATKQKQKDEDDLKNRLRAFYDQHLQRDSDDSEDEDDFWSHTLHRCKVCMHCYAGMHTSEWYTYSKLLVHLASKSKCRQEYPEELLKDIEHARKTYSGRKKSRFYYQDHGKREKALEYQDHGKEKKLNNTKKIRQK